MIPVAVPLGPREPGPVRPDPARLPRGATTRFAPAPTGWLHLGHLVNAIYAWGIAAATGGRVLLRIEDHDRQRSRAVFDAGIARRSRPSRARVRPSPPPPVRRRRAVRCSGRDAARPRAGVCLHLHPGGPAGVARPGCPGACRARGVPDDAPGASIRVDLGPGEEAVDDLLAGRIAGRPSDGGDLTLRDRLGNWSYPLCAVVDDARTGVDTRRPRARPARGDAGTAPPRPTARPADADARTSITRCCASRRARSSRRPTATRASARSSTGVRAPPTCSGSPPRPSDCSTSRGASTRRRSAASSPAERPQPPGAGPGSRRANAGRTLRPDWPPDQESRVDRSSISQAWSRTCHAIRRAA